MSALPLPVPAAVPEPIRWIVMTILVVLAVPYVLGPVLIRFSHETRRNPTLIMFDPGERPAPEAVQEFLDDTHAKLWGCGFEVIARVALPDLMPNVKAIFMLLARPESHDNAMAVAAFGEGGGSTVRKFYVE